jgi:hypothetical protein
VVLPQTTLGQISIALWRDQTPPREKRKKKGIITNNNKKDT